MAGADGENEYSRRGSASTSPRPGCCGRFVARAEPIADRRLAASAGLPQRQDLESAPDLGLALGRDGVRDVGQG